MRKFTFVVIGLVVSLSGCRASPLYIGQWDNSRPSAPAGVPRDDRGEPIMANLPPLGPVAIPTGRQANSEPPQN